MATTASEYLQRGWAPIPIPPRSKAPVITGWQNLRLTENDISKYFTNGENIGVLTGEPSGWLVDVDLDCAEAIKLAPEHLPLTVAIFGRESKPKSHYLYQSVGPIETRKFKAPDGEMLVELRATGLQTVFPGSVHISGEPIRWDSEGEPALVGAEELTRCVENLANAVREKRGICHGAVTDSTAGGRNDETIHAFDVPTDHPSMFVRARGLERARKYLAKLPPAISGQGGHDQTFRAACELFRFGLTDAQARQLLEEYNARCEPPWNDRELAHKLESARDEVIAKSEFGYRLKTSAPSAPVSEFPPSKPAGEMVQICTINPDGEAPAPQTKVPMGTLPADDPDGRASKVPIGTSPANDATNPADNAPGPRVSTPKFISMRDIQGRTDAANVDRMLAEFGHDVKYVPTWRKWLAWDGKRWKLDDGDTVPRKALKFAKSLWPQVGHEAEFADKEDLAKMQTYVRRSNDVGRMTGTLNMLGPYVAISHEDLDADPYLFNVANGTVELRTGKLRPHDQADMLTKISPAAYDLDADCPTWKKFLSDIFDGDEDLESYVRRLSGYSLSGVVKEHILAFLHGVGSNGKSTFTEILLHVFGDYGMKCNAEMFLEKKQPAHLTERADLFGKRLAVAIEADAGRHFAEALLKELTGGDRIRARRLYEDHWEFTPSHTIWLAANHRPIVKGTDDGFWRRMKLIPFLRQWDSDGTRPELPRADKHLLEKLKAEMSGVLMWLLAGFAEWQAEGVETPDIVRNATNEYRLDSDLIGQFIAEECTVGPLESCLASELYQAYVRWCDAGHLKAKSQTAFGRDMKDRGYDKRQAPGTRKTMRDGIALKDAGNSWKQLS